MYQCATHAFETDDLELKRQHRANFDHTTNITANCQECNTVIEYIRTGRKATNKFTTFCQSCRDGILSVPITIVPKDGGESQ